MNNFSFNTGAQIAQEIRDNSAVYPFSITTEQFVAAMQSPVQLTGWPAEMGAQITTVGLTLIQEADPEQGITEDSVMGVVPLAPESSLVADPETGAPVNKIVWKGGLGMQEGGTELEYKIAIDGGYLSVETSFGPDAANVPEWEANQSYFMNQCVKHENVVYMALSNVTDAVWTPSHWSDPMLSPYNVSAPASLNLILYMAPKVSYAYQHLYELLESARLWFTNDNAKGQQFYTGYNVDHHVYTVVATESNNRRFTFWGGDFGNAIYDSTSQTWQIETIKSLSGLGYAKYNQAQAYAVGDIVAKAGGYRDGLYRCKAAVAANEAWDDQKWDEITTAGQIAELVSDMSSVAALAEGRTKSYVVNALTDITYSSESADGDLLGVTAIIGATLSEMKVGDVVYVKDVNVPDYWVSAVASGSLTLSKMETKLTGYVTGTGLTANKIITGNGGSAVQSSGIGISTAKPASADNNNVPTVGAVYAGLQDKIDKSHFAEIYYDTDDGYWFRNIPLSEDQLWEYVDNDVRNILITQNDEQTGINTIVFTGGLIKDANSNYDPSFFAYFGDRFYKLVTQGNVSNIVEIPITKAQVGLGNVDNTSDANKPISTATQTALNKKLGRMVVEGTLPDSSTPVAISLTADQINAIRSGQVDQILIYDDGSSVTYAFDKMFVNDGEADYHFYCHLHFDSSDDERYRATLEGNSFTIRKVDPAHDSTKQDTLVNQTNIKSVDGQSILGSGNLNSVKMTSITWADLKALRDGGNLVPGMQYRITDYTCTTITTDTSSAGHVFDVIVTADSTSVLNENARAIQHVGDTYFANSDLTAWELRYCIDNDTTRFAWADSTNGKGVIYRLVDEFGNDLPYDFKNIQFNRSGTYRYTFFNSSDDGSLNGYNLKIYDNVIKPYKVNGVQKLNFNTFSLSGAGTIQGQCYSNEFGFNSHDNKIDRGFHNNSIESDFYSNTISTSATGNNIGHSFHDNTIGSYFQNNTIGSTFASNNTGSAFANNQIGNGFSSNIVGDTFQGNIVGTNFKQNKIGDSVYSSIYVRWCKFDSNLQYLNLTSGEVGSNSSWIQNVHLHSGLIGESAQNPLTISVYARNLPFEVEYYLDDSGNLTMSNFISKITWNALKNLRDNGNLVPGRKYRITDYTTTTAQVESRSAGHVFDIIVEAISSSKLSEKAQACLHDGDTYFANSRLTAWQLWYALDNDPSRFAWADTSEDGDVTSIKAPSMTYERDSDRDHSGDAHPYAWSYTGMSWPITIYTDSVKPSVGDSTYSSSTAADPAYTISAISGNFLPVGRGVIYRLIDEFGNDVPYDFKNILFTDSAATPKYTNAYTFSYTESSVIKDASLLGLSKSCYSNVMKEYINSSKQQLNFNVFYASDIYFMCYANTFGNGCYSNTFNYYCYNNTFGNDCNSNTFGSNCYNNTFGNDCNSNTFGSNCYNNTFGNDCNSNTFGDSCLGSNFENNCSSNIVGGYSTHNKFGISCSSNTFGLYCTYNTLGIGCTNNAFGDNCTYNTFSDYCRYITFGDSSSVTNYYRLNIVDNGCQYLYISGNGTASSSNSLQLIHIHSGVVGSSSSNRKTITVDRKLAYETNIVPAGTVYTEV